MTQLHKPHQMPPIRAELYGSETATDPYAAAHKAEKSTLASLAEYVQLRNHTNHLQLPYNELNEKLDRELLSFGIFERFGNLGNTIDVVIMSDNDGAPILDFMRDQGFDQGRIDFVGKFLETLPADSTLLADLNARADVYRPWIDSFPAADGANQQFVANAGDLRGTIESAFGDGALDEKVRFINDDFSAFVAGLSDPDAQGIAGDSRNTLSFFLGLGKK